MDLSIYMLVTKNKIIVENLSFTKHKEEKNHALEFEIKNLNFQLDYLKKSLIWKENQLIEQASLKNDEL
jgi:hypothetical protein